MDNSFVGAGILVSSICTGLAVIITAMKAERKLDHNTAITENYHKDTKATQEKIHTLVNSNMTRMFQALAGACICIIILVWYSIIEAKKARR